MRNTFEEGKETENGSEKNRKENRKEI